jgi:hypothetical protein
MIICDSACAYVLTQGLTFPCGSLFRPLPKCTLGMYPAKALHDDRNSCIIPLMWQSVVGHDSLNLVFVGKQMKVEMRASHQQFCWFMGWIPHKTEMIGDMPRFWISHSAYSSVGHLININFGLPVWTSGLDLRKRTLCLHV